MAWKPGPAARSIVWADGVGLVEVVDLEGDDGDEIGLAEETLGVGEGGEGVGGIVLVEAGGEDAGDGEALVAGDEAEGGELALGAGDENGVADLRAEGFGEVVADDDGGCRLGGRGVFQRGCGAGFDGLEEVAYGALLGGDDAFDEGSAAAWAARDKDLAVEAGGGGGNVREGAETGEQGAPVADAVAGDAHEVDVGGGAEEAFLEVAAHAVGDGERDDERGDAGCDAEDADGGDDADYGLAALGAEITRGNEELETHVGLAYSPAADYFAGMVTTMSLVSPLTVSGCSMSP